MFTSFGQVKEMTHGNFSIPDESETESQAVLSADVDDVGARVAAANTGSSTT